MENNVDPNGIITIKQEGFYYSVSNNDARILNKYLGYKLYGINKLKTGFPVNGKETVLKKLDKLEMNYNIIDKNNNVIVSKRFENNKYEVIDTSEYYATDVSVIEQPKPIKLDYENKLKTYIYILQGLSEGYNVFTGEQIENLDEDIKGFTFEMAMYFDKRLKTKEKQDNETPNHNKKWTEEEDRQLVAEYKSGKSINELCEFFSRSSGAIRSRLLRFINL